MVSGKIVSHKYTWSDGSSKKTAFLKPAGQRARERARHIPTTQNSTENDEHSKGSSSSTCKETFAGFLPTDQLRWRPGSGFNSGLILPVFPPAALKHAGRLEWRA